MKDKYWWYETKWHQKMVKALRVAGMGESTQETYGRTIRKLTEFYDKTPARRLSKIQGLSGPTFQDNRILTVKNRTVTFCYRKTSLPVLTFISRFLQHVLPAGFMKVRHYGFMNANCAITFQKIRQMVIICLRDLSLILSDNVSQPPSSIPQEPFCSRCGGRLIYRKRLINSTPPSVQRPSVLDQHSTAASPHSPEAFQPSAVSQR